MTSCKYEAFISSFFLHYVQKLTFAMFLLNSWDQAVYQCVSESLAKSGVLLNYAKSSIPDGENKAARDPKSIKWHDLALDEYAGAAAQVHSVVFAQLGTLSREFLLLVRILS